MGRQPPPPPRRRRTARPCRSTHPSCTVSPAASYRAPGEGLSRAGMGFCSACAAPSEVPPRLGGARWSAAGRLSASPPERERCPLRALHSQPHPPRSVSSHRLHGQTRRTRRRGVHRAVRHITALPPPRLPVARCALATPTRNAGCTEMPADSPSLPVRPAPPPVARGALLTAQPSPRAAPRVLSLWHIIIPVASPMDDAGAVASPPPLLQLQHEGRRGLTRTASWSGLRALGQHTPPQPRGELSSLAPPTSRLPNHVRPRPASPIVALHCARSSSATRFPKRRTQPHPSSPGGAAATQTPWLDGNRHDTATQTRAGYGRSHPVPYRCVGGCRKHHHEAKREPSLIVVVRVRVQCDRRLMRIGSALLVPHPVEPRVLARARPRPCHHRVPRHHLARRAWRAHAAAHPAASRTRRPRLRASPRSRRQAVHAPVPSAVSEESGDGLRTHGRARWGVGGCSHVGAIVSTFRVPSPPPPHSRVLTLRRTATHHHKGREQQRWERTPQGQQARVAWRLLGCTEPPTPRHRPIPPERRAAVRSAARRRLRVFSAPPRTGDAWWETLS